MMCWNYDKTPWEEFPDMSISLLSTISNSKEFRLKIPPQVNNITITVLTVLPSCVKSGSPIVLTTLSPSEKAAGTVANVTTCAVTFQHPSMQLPLHSNTRWHALALTLLVCIRVWFLHGKTYLINNYYCTARCNSTTGSNIRSKQWNLIFRSS